MGPKLQVSGDKDVRKGFIETPFYLIRLAILKEKV